MKTKTDVKAGIVVVNHNETLVRDRLKATALRVKTKVKAGLSGANHNETLVRDSARTLPSASYGPLHPAVACQIGGIAFDRSCCDGAHPTRLTAPQLSPLVSGAGARENEGTRGSCTG
jgi:hypothetical protein